MAGGHAQQHRLEFGGSPVATEFPGLLNFDLIDRIPHISVSHQFTEETARAIRYVLVATVGPERPFYHRYLYVVLDVRMIGEWLPGGAEFVAALRERMTKLGGELFLVGDEGVPVTAAVPRFTTVEDAITAAKKMRAERRAAILGR